MKLSEYARKNSISCRTAYRHFKDGMLNAKQLPTGTIVVLDETYVNENKNEVVLYARVSSSENKDNLDSQMERLRSFAIANGYIIKQEVKEIGSELNDNRKKLLKLINEDGYSKIIVEHKDRFARFGTTIIEELLSKNGKELVVINQVDGDTQDLMQDFVSIITSFTARLYGLRRSRRKTEKIIEELQK